MSTYRPGDASAIRSVDQLREALAPRGAEPGRLGLEWELLPCRPDGSLAPYGGPEGVEQAFRALARRGYDPHRERGRIVGLASPSGAFLGLEPGGQVEVATPPARRIARLARELGRHARALRGASAPLGWRPEAWGLAPVSRPEELPDVPKERYAILADHLRKSGHLGRHMMKLAASSQFSLDTPGDRGLGEQVDGALRLLPLLAGWLANGPVSLGRKGRRKTLRPEIWRRTDRSRCGLPNFLFKPQMDPLGAWAHYYLGREALFFVRRGRWLRGDGRSFRAWLREPGPLAPMTMDDWTLHISSCFPDLRFRGYLELRTADSVPLPLLLGAAGLCVGLLGDPARVGAWRGLLPDPDPSRTRMDILGAAAGGGGWAPSAGPSPREVAPALFRKAAEGLRALGEDPGWLEPLERSARSGSCPADAWRRVPGIGWRGPEALAGAAP